MICGDHGMLLPLLGMGRRRRLPRAAPRILAGTARLSRLHPRRGAQHTHCDRGESNISRQGDKRSLPWSSIRARNARDRNARDRKAKQRVWLEAAHGRKALRPVRKSI